MFKKGFVFGLLGFLVALLVIHLTSPDKSTSQESGSFSYEGGLDGWVSFGNILEEYFKDPFLNKDPIFIEMFMLKVYNPINISNKPEIIITENNNSIFWTNGSSAKGTVYGKWKGENGNVLVSDSISIVRIDITSANRRIAGYVYLEIRNRPNPKDFAIDGWKYYGSVLAASNTLRGDVAINNRSGIRDYINKVTIKDNLLHLTILGKDEALIWDKDDNSSVGRRLENGGWIGEESNKNEPNRFYYESSVRQQDNKIADIHFLVNLPFSGKAGFIASLFAKVKILFRPERLIPSAIAFFVFFLAGAVLSKGAPSQGTVTRKTTKLTPELENQIQQLKEEINRLEETRADVTEAVAKEQKKQKDLENEIKSLEGKKGEIPASAEGLTEELIEKQKTKESLQQEIEQLKQEKENIAKELEVNKEAAVAAAAEAATKEESEEELLFDNLLGEDSKTSAMKKEEIELTQRIVAKRREEIDLSSKIESRRKELLELQQKIEKLKGK